MWVIKRPASPYGACAIQCCSRKQMRFAPTNEESDTQYYSLPFGVNACIPVISRPKIKP